MALPLESAGPGPRDAPGGRGVERLEVGLLLEGIHQHYGFDFRSYAPGPLTRGIHHAMEAEGVRTVSALQDRVLHDPAAMERFTGFIGVHVTAFFREPAMFAALRREVFPLLLTYPSVRVWLAGCATGEEAYSLAVLLDQAAILDRCRLYATDMNSIALAQGRRGAYSTASLDTAQARFAQSGGVGELAAQADTRGKLSTFNARLRGHITWAEHNLVTDASFNDFHLVVCSNVLIYFDRTLQRQVHTLLDESVLPGGFLAVSCRETLGASPVKTRYRRLGTDAAVFHKGRR